MTDALGVDKYRTGDAPLTGSVSYRLTMPSCIWFIAEAADALQSMTIEENWTQDGTVTIFDATQAAIAMLKGFNTMIGQIVPYVTATCPDNCLPCDGTEYNRVDYPELYAALAPVFQTDADHFVVPDLRGKTIIGLSSTYEIGDSGGETEHTLITSEMPAHSHTDTGHQHTTGNSITIAAVVPGEGPVLAPNPIPSLTGSASANLTDTGGGEAHNNMQPYVALGYAVIAL